MNRKADQTNSMKQDRGNRSERKGRNRCEQAQSSHQIEIGEPVLRSESIKAKQSGKAQEVSDSPCAQRAPENFAIKAKRDAIAINDATEVADRISES